MATQFCITRLDHLEIVDPLGRGDRIADDIFITNDIESLRQLRSPAMMSAFGALEMRALRRPGVVAYRARDVTTGPDSPHGEQALLEFLGELKKLQMALWLVKDNAVSFENGFLEWPLGDPDGMVSVNHWEGRCWNAEGGADSVRLTRQELRHARELHSRIWSPGPVPPRGAEPLQEVLDRVSRGLYFLQAARSRPTFSVRVSNYCTAFEALLSTDTTELSHKLAERVAWLLGDTPELRLDLFKRMKNAYAIRSKAVHGSSLQAKKFDSQLRVAARDCDDLLRKAFHRIFHDDDLRGLFSGNSDNGALEEALIRITLGATLRDERPN